MKYKISNFLFFIQTFLLVLHKTTSQRNAVIGTPIITCEASRITVVINTERPFTGRVFIKGNSNREECVTDFSSQGSGEVDSQSAQVAIDYNLCNTERIRQLQPPGIIYANTLVVQFHNVFITKGDKAYHIRCFYSEQEQAVTQRFDVSMLPTGAITHELEMPECGYSVRRGTANGPIVRSAQVGDIVYHRWECAGSDAYGMMVHSCTVEDASGARTEILNDFGCSLDNLLLPDLQYNSELTLAYSQSQVFKYPDNSFIYFRCQIRICTRIDEGCRGISPPSCDGNVPLTPNRVPRSINSRNGTSYGAARSARTSESHDFDVLTKEILVLEEGDKLDLNTMLTQEQSQMLEAHRETDSLTVQLSNDVIARHLCSHRLALLSFLISSFVFFIGSIAFMAHTVSRRQPIKGLQT